MTSLIRYEAACVALAAAVKAEEVMQVRLEAKAIEAVARVAKNFDLEIDAVKLRTRAEVRLGEMLEEAEKQGLINGHGGKRRAPGQDSDPASCPPTLKEIGVDNKLSAHSRRLNGIGQRAVNAMLERFESESRGRRRLALDVIREQTAKRSTDTRRNLARELSDASVALCASGRMFPVVYADPAWARKAGIGNRAYENHYGTMSWDDIIAMPVAKRLLPDAWGFLWIPRAHMFALHPVEVDTPIGRTTIKMPLAWAVMKAWGFDSYSTCFVWTKTDDAHPDDHGSGLIVWDQDEILLLFKRGKGLPMPDGQEKVGSNYRERSAGHSAKPPYYRDMINRMTGTVPVLELFAREDDDHVLPENFYTWGNQSKGTADAPVDAAGNEIVHDASGEVIEDQNTRSQASEESQTQNDSPVTDDSHPQAGGETPNLEVAKEQLAEVDDQLEIPAFLRRSENSVASA